MTHSTIKTDDRDPADLDYTGPADLQPMAAGVEPASAAVSGKVKASTTGGTSAAAITTLVLYLLGQIPAVHAWPDYVQAALLVVVTGVVTLIATFGSGYLARHNSAAQ